MLWKDVLKQRINNRIGEVMSGLPTSHTKVGDIGCVSYKTELTDEEEKQVAIIEAVWQELDAVRKFIDELPMTNFVETVAKVRYRNSWGDDMFAAQIDLGVQIENEEHWVIICEDSHGKRRIIPNVGGTYVSEEAAIGVMERFVDKGWTLQEYVCPLTLTEVRERLANYTFDKSTVLPESVEKDNPYMDMAAKLPKGIAYEIMMQAHEKVLKSEVAFDLHYYTAIGYIWEKINDQTV